MSTALKPIASYRAQVYRILKADMPHPELYLEAQIIFSRFSSVSDTI